MLDGEQHLLVLEGTTGGSIARIWEENPKTHQDFKVDRIKIEQSSTSWLFEPVNDDDMVNGIFKFLNNIYSGSIQLGVKVLRTTLLPTIPGHYESETF